MLHYNVIDFLLEGKCDNREMLQKSLPHHYGLSAITVLENNIRLSRGGERVPTSVEIAVNTPLFENKYCF